ncbi:MAG: hypothetical protein ABII01_06815 [Candidatus Woesearchaeota archaeon]
MIDDESILEILDTYLLWRKITNAEFTRAREFRRHVTMTAIVDNGAIEVNIDVIYEYYDKTKEFFKHIKDIIESS